MVQLFPNVGREFSRLYVQEVSGSKIRLHNGVWVNKSDLQWHPDLGVWQSKQGSTELN